MPHVTWRVASRRIKSHTICNNCVCVCLVHRDEWVRERVQRIQILPTTAIALAVANAVKKRIRIFLARHIARRRLWHETSNCRPRIETRIAQHDLIDQVSIFFKTKMWLDFFYYSSGVVSLIDWRLRERKRETCKVKILLKFEKKKHY